MEGRVARGLAARALAMAVVVLGATVPAALWAAEPAAAESAVLLEAKLPSGRHGVSAVTLGGSLYVAGGNSGGSTATSYSRDVVRYDTNGTVTPLGAVLPVGRVHAAAVSNGTHAFFFGGEVYQSYTNRIVRYDPVTNTAVNMTTTLPSTRAGMSAVWNGTHAFLFGGHNGTFFNRILRYDPRIDELLQSNATLPTARTWTAAAWDPRDRPEVGCAGGCAYILGGHPTQTLTQVLRYNPTRDNVTIVANASLPGARLGMSAVWTEQGLMAFGGGPSTTTSVNQILRLNLTTERVEVLAAYLPDSRRFTGVAMLGGMVYVVGGVETTGGIADLVRVDPRANTGTFLAGLLPSARFATAVVWTGTKAYIFGGSPGGRDILEYNPANTTVTMMQAKLPGIRDYASAVWNGTHAFIFGGNSGGTLYNTILRYDPIRDNLTAMNVTLPGTRTATSAVWDGQHAYIFGGQTTSTGYTNQIVRYDPELNNVTVLAATLPSSRAYTAAVWNGSVALVFGGLAGSTQFDTIVRYNPANGTANQLVPRLPTPRAYLSAVWAHDTAYIFGGLGTVALNEVATFRSDEIVGTLPHTMPTARRSTSAVWTGTEALVIGGVQTDGTDFDQVLRFSPCWPPSLQAEGTLHNGYYRSEVTVSLGLPHAWCEPYLAVDGAAPQPGPEVVVDSDGHHAVMGWADGAWPGETLRFTLDRSPASTVAELSGPAGDAGWWKGDVSVTLQPSDAFSGVAATRFVLDGGPQQEGTSLVVSGEAPHTLAFASEDGAGNVEAEQALAIGIDATPPVTTAAVTGVGANGWFRGPATVQFEAQDATSGPSTTLVSVDGGPFAALPGNATTLTTHGEHAVAFFSRDVAGNVEAVRNLTVRIDLRPPTTNATLLGEPGDDGWWRSAVDATIQAADEGSGIAEVRHRVDGGPEQAGTSVTVSGDGNHTLGHFALDLAGNLGAERVEAFRIDATPPSVGLARPVNSTLYLEDAPTPLPVPGLPPIVVGNLTVRANAEDATSGVREVRFFVDNETLPRAVDTLPPYEFVWTAFDERPGGHVLTAQAVDRAGNTQATNTTVLSAPSSPEYLEVDADAACRVVFSDGTCRSFGSPSTLSSYLWSVLPALGQLCRAVFNTPCGPVEELERLLRP